MTALPLVERHCGRLRPDSSRVIARLFVPGHDLQGGEGRASRVVESILSLSDDDVVASLSRIMVRFDGRHRDLIATFNHHAERIANRLDGASTLSSERWLLLGAAFTHEYSVEAAALCNPSVVASPDQSDVPPGAVRFVLSVRQIGEGHRSSIGFRTGLVAGGRDVTVERAGPFTTAGTIGTGSLQADAFRGLALRVGGGSESAVWVLDGLGEQFTPDELYDRLARLEEQVDTRRRAGETARRLREFARRTYEVTFDPGSELSERVLFPATAVEANGIEDARFVRFVDDAGGVIYHATYTAYDGRAIAQQLLSTTDFTTFSSSPLLGKAATNKGMALFPRRIGGRYAALSRADGATNAIGFTDHLGHWPSATQLPHRVSGWDVVQVGNCGSPIETSEGWLVLTHGVGAMRTYAIGAMLLDLDDPTVVLGELEEPLLSPQADEQDGYVPNVVYSCGAMLHDSVLLVPYGIGDGEIGFATVPIDGLLAAMR